jgi:hypothetical protein
MADDEILALARRVDMRRKFALMAVLLGLVVAGAGASQFTPGEQVEFSPLVLDAVFAVAGAMILIGGLVMLFSRTPLEARAGRVAMIRAERHRAKRNVAFLMMPVSLGLMLMGVVQALNRTVDGGPVGHIQAFEVCCFIVFLVTFVALLSGRGLDRWAKPVLDDELSRQIRARALGLGYLVMAAGLAGLVATSLFDRGLTIDLIPVVAALGVGAASVRLFWLERAAGADGGE